MAESLIGALSHQKLSIPERNNLQILNRRIKSASLVRPVSKKNSTALTVPCKEKTPQNYSRRTISSILELQNNENLGDSKEFLKQFENGSHEIKRTLGNHSKAKLDEILSTRISEINNEMQNLSEKPQMLEESPTVSENSSIVQHNSQSSNDGESRVLKRRVSFAEGTVGKSIHISPQPGIMDNNLNQIKPILKKKECPSPSASPSSILLSNLPQQKPSILDASTSPMLAKYFLKVNTQYNSCIKPSLTDKFDLISKSSLPTIETGAKKSPQGVSSFSPNQYSPIFDTQSNQGSSTPSSHWSQSNQDASRVSRNTNSYKVTNRIRPASSRLKRNLELFSMPIKKFSVGNANCIHPNQVSFCKEHLEYRFYHPANREPFVLTIQYKEMQNVSVIGSSLLFRVNFKFEQFTVIEFNPSNILHKIKIQIASPSNMYTLKENILPLMHQCKGL